MGVKILLGSYREASHPDTLRALLAEFVSTLLYVFAGVGSVSAFDKLQEGSLTPSGLTIVALAHAFALFAAVAIAINTSGGHVNPAVTFGLLFGGHVTIMQTVLYWIAQLLGSSVACYLLKIISKMDTPVHALGSGVSSWEGMACEIVITFGLIYTVYATTMDPKRDSVETIAPLAIGLVVGANILGAGPFSGGSMNPARAFGAALVSGNWLNQWVYWVGPLLGAALAGMAYSAAFISDTHEHLQQDPRGFISEIHEHLRPACAAAACE